MSQELENHRPFLLLCNTILFQNDNNPPEIFLMKKIIYVHVENVGVYEFCLSRNISKQKKNRRKNTNIQKRIVLHSNRKGRWFSSSCDMTQSARYRSNHFNDFV
jgi:hypothetical protein